MPRTLLTSYPSRSRGTDWAYEDADPVNGNSFENNSNVILELWNNTETTVTISMHIGYLFDGDIVLSPREEVMEPGENYTFGRFPAETYNIPGTGLMHVDFSGPCKVAAVEVA